MAATDRHLDFYVASVTVIPVLLLAVGLQKELWRFLAGRDSRVIRNGLLTLLIGIGTTSSFAIYCRGPRDPGDACSWTHGG